MQSIVHIDLVGKTEVVARKLLLGAARGTRAKPSQKPQFPGANESPQSQPPTFPGLESCQLIQLRRPTTAE
jgi:hypothetical protein